MNDVKKSDVLNYMRSITPKRIEDYRDFTVAEWNDYWLVVYCKGVKETTFRSYESISENHIKPVLGEIKLNELSNEDVQLFINSLKLGIGLEEPLSAKTIKNIHGTLHKCLEVAKNNRYIDVNPADKIILPVIEHFEMHSLTEEEMAVYKRGRNAKSYTMAKNATMSDYRRATGFEALMGYLYLTEQWDRMLELIKTGIEEGETNGR